MMTDITAKSKKSRQLTVLHRSVNDGFSHSPGLAVTFLSFCGGPWDGCDLHGGRRGMPDQAPARLFAYRHPRAVFPERRTENPWSCLEIPCSVGQGKGSKYCEIIGEAETVGLENGPIFEKSLFFSLLAGNCARRLV